MNNLAQTYFKLGQHDKAISMFEEALEVNAIAHVAISKHLLLSTVWTQLRLRSHQIFYEIFTRKQFLPTSAGNAQAQLHFRDDQQRAFGICNISNSLLVLK